MFKINHRESHPITAEYRHHCLAVVSLAARWPFNCQIQQVIGPFSRLACYTVANFSGVHAFPSAYWLYLCFVPMFLFSSTSLSLALYSTFRTPLPPQLSLGSLTARRFWHDLTVSVWLFSTILESVDSSKIWTLKKRFVFEYLASIKPEPAPGKLQKKQKAKADLNLRLLQPTRLHLMPRRQQACIAYSYSLDHLCSKRPLQNEISYKCPLQNVMNSECLL